MEQGLRFGLDLGRLALLKKRRFGLIMNNFLGRSFHVFMGKKSTYIENIATICSALKDSIQFQSFF